MKGSAPAPRAPIPVPLLLLFLTATGPGGKPSGIPSSFSTAPSPPLEFRLDLVEFLSSAPGGLATVRVTLRPEAAMDEVTVSGKLGAGMRFGDGSSEKSWRVPSRTGTEESFTEMVEVPGDGVFVLVFHAESRFADGTPVHRSRGIRIFAGIERPAPQPRGRALEFPAVHSGGDSP